MVVGKNIIVAIELGSSKIRGVAGYKDDAGNLHVLALEEEDSRSCIRKGIVYNVDKTVSCLKLILGRIEDVLDMQVTKVYVGMNGKSLRTAKHTITRLFNSKMAISAEHVQDMLAENARKTYPNYEVLAVVPQEYRLEQESSAEPVGVLSSHMEGTFLNVMARSEMKEYLQNCLSMLNIEVAGYLVSPLLLAHKFLSDTEKRMGCVLIDFGASVTTVAIYRKSLLRYIGVVPLGADNITQDICSLAIDEAEAEDLKIQYCAALSDMDEDAPAKNLLLNASRSVDERELKTIVEARQWEILNNVAERIEQSGYKDILPQGVVAMGGGAQLKAMDKAISECLKIEKVRFVKQYPQSLQSECDAVLGCTHITLLALLDEGTESCVAEKEKVVIPTEFQFQEYPEDVKSEEETEDEKILPEEPEVKEPEEPETDDSDIPEEQEEEVATEKKDGEQEETAPKEKKPGFITRMFDFLGKLVDEEST